MRRVAVALFAAAVLGLPKAAVAAPILVASFADPGGDTFMTYTTDGSTSTFSGAYTGSDLDTFELFWPVSEAGTYQDVTFTFSTITETSYIPIGGTSSVTNYSGGTVDFYDASNSLLFQITFDSARLTDPGGSIGSTDLDLMGVNLFLPSGDPYGDPEDFSFTLIRANPTGATVFGARAAALAGNTTATVSWGSSFNASAEPLETDRPVPEPGSMLLLGTGLMGLAASARRRLQRRNKA